MGDESEVVAAGGSRAGEQEAGRIPRSWILSVPGPPRLGHDYCTSQHCRAASTGAGQRRVQRDGAFPATDPDTRGLTPPDCCGAYGSSPFCMGPQTLGTR